MDLFNKKKIKEQEKLIKDLTSHAEFLASKIESETGFKEYLENENKKLLEWIESILKEFGTFNVRERRVNIPIYKNTVEVEPYDAETVGTIKEAVIVIPEIVIHKRLFVERR